MLLVQFQRVLSNEVTMNLADLSYIEEKYIEGCK